MFRSQLLDSITRIAIASIKAIVILGVAICFYRATSVLAGKYTFAQIGMSFLGDLKLTDGAALLVSGGSIGWGAIERKLKKDNIERLTARIKQLELQIDPNRTSSKLTKRGDTPPEVKR
jgi:hypothetical protein